MKVIYKYPFIINDIVIVEMPVNTEVLDVQYQNGDLFLWAIVDKDEKWMREYYFNVYGTGHEFNTEKKHFKTVQYGSFVWHIFF